MKSRTNLALSRPSQDLSSRPLLSGVPEPVVREESVARVLVRMLESLGVEHAFGIVGGAIGPFCDALLDSSIEIVHCRHEGGSAFAAAEAHFVSDKPTVVFATTGPGLTNALTGLLSARTDGAKVILISGATSTAQRGRFALQETSAYAMPLSGILGKGPLFHFAATLDDPRELPSIARHLARGLASPGGFVAHLSVPINAQSVSVPELPAARMSSLGPCGPTREQLETCAELLRAGPFTIWVGFGARRSPELLRAFAERTGAHVMSSPRAKGIFPEDHPQFVGVTGFGGSPDAQADMLARRPRHVLVLGTRLGEFTSFWDKNLVPSHGFIHVDLDVDAMGTAYPDVETFGVQAEIGAFLEGMLELVGRPSGVIRKPAKRTRPALPPPRAEGPVQVELLMDAVQRVVVDGSDALVMAEPGNSFAWTNHSLCIREANRYRISTGTASMGHFVTGVVGAAIARRGKVVAVVGDGAMLMNNEISTAVKYRAKAVWIVMNDSKYGMVEQGQQALGMRAVETDIPRVDFALFARSMGADGVRVTSDGELDAALSAALDAEGPFVVDVAIDPTTIAPTIRRMLSLKQQGSKGSQAAKR